MHTSYLHMHKDFAAYHGSSGSPACYTRPLFATSVPQSTRMCWSCSNRAGSCHRCLQVMLHSTGATQNLPDKTPRSKLEHRNVFTRSTPVSCIDEKWLIQIKYLRCLPDQQGPPSPPPFPPLFSGAIEDVSPAFSVMPNGCQEASWTW